MDRTKLLKSLLKIATGAVTLKRYQFRQHLHRTVSRVVHVKQYQQAERSMTEALIPFFQAQIDYVAERLKAVAEDKSFWMEEKYSPGQPRDEGGRWSSGGGGAMLGPDTGGQFGGGGSGGGSGGEGSESPPPRFKDFEEGKVFIEKNYGTWVYKESGFKDTTALKYTQEMADECHRMKSEFPAVSEYMSHGGHKSVDFRNSDTLSEGNTGECNMMSGNIEIAKGLRVNSNAKPKYGEWDVGRDFGTIFRHEYGHRFYRQATGMQQNRSQWNHSVGDYIGKGGAKKGKKFPVSKYAASHKSELFAESFAAYTSKKYKRGSLPRDIEGMLDGFTGGGSAGKSYNTIGTKKPQEASISLASIVFNPRDWDRQLVNAVLPTMVRGMGEAMKGQMAVLAASSFKSVATEEKWSPGQPRDEGGRWSSGGGGGDRNERLMNWVGSPAEETDLFSSIGERLHSGELKIPETMAIDELVSNPSGRVAVGIQKAVHQIYGSGKGADPNAIELAQSLISDARSSGLPNQIPLYRGRKRESDVGLLVSFTDKKEVAQGFAEEFGSGGEVVQEKRPKASLLTWHGSKYWPKKQKWEGEYIFVSGKARKLFELEEKWSPGQPRDESGRWSSGGGGSGSEPSASETTFRAAVANDTFNYYALRVDGSPEQKFMKSEVIKAHEACGIKPGQGRGYCADVSISAWDSLGKPKSLRPYSVMTGTEEEHVLLFNKRTDMVVDSTGYQFDNRVFNYKENTGYSKWQRLTNAEIDDARTDLSSRSFDLEEKYSPGQPRDESGRWSSGGGGSMMAPDTGGQFGGGGSGDIEDDLFEVEASLSEKYGVIPKIKGVGESESLGILQEAESNLSHMKENFPAISAHMENENRRAKLTVYSEEEFAKVPGVQKGNIGLCDGWTGDIHIASGKVVTDASPKYGRFTVGKDVGTTIRHEFGHRFYYHELGTENQGRWKEVSKKYVGNFFGRSKVSHYGSANEEELFSESFAAYTSKNYKRGGLPKRIEGMLDGFTGGGEKSFKSTKASTASEWLESQEDLDLEDIEFLTPYGVVDMGFASEYPRWMKREIKSQLQDTFSKPYWKEINNSSLIDVSKFLDKGLKDGWSISRMASEIRGAAGPGFEYYKRRAENIARTESGHALNGARDAGYREFKEQAGEAGNYAIKSWLSVLGNTTRDAHADLDGVAADKDGMWNLNGVRIPWPGHIRLPARDRCNCQCTILTELGFGAPEDQVEAIMRELEGNRVEGRSFDLEEKYSPGQPRDEGGRWSSGGGGALLGPDTGGQFGGGGGMAGTARGGGGKLTLTNGEPLPDHVPKNIPPAWTNVRVNTNPGADLLVQGRDKKGRRQSVYSDNHNTRQQAKKFARTAELRSKDKQITKEIKKDLKSSNHSIRENAAVMSLIKDTGIRPGGSGDTRAKVQAYGATTLEGRHVRVSTAGKVRLQFVGKKGVRINVPVVDKSVARLLVQRKEKAGAKGKLFDTYDAKLLKYTKSKDGGLFKTKDFRTAKGTNVAIDMVKKMKQPKTDREYKKQVRKVAKAVSKQLGNTPTVALQSYIDPSVFASWRV